MPSIFDIPIPQILDITPYSNYITSIGIATSAGLLVFILGVGKPRVKWISVILSAVVLALLQATPQLSAPLIVQAKSYMFILVAILLVYAAILVAKSKIGRMAFGLALIALSFAIGNIAAGYSLPYMSIPLVIFISGLVFSILGMATYSRGRIKAPKESGIFKAIGAEQEGEKRFFEEQENFQDEYGAIKYLMGVIRPYAIGGKHIAYWTSDKARAEHSLKFIDKKIKSSRNFINRLISQTRYAEKQAKMAAKKEKIPGVKAVARLIQIQDRHEREFLKIDHEMKRNFELLKSYIYSRRFGPAYSVASGMLYQIEYSSKAVSRLKNEIDRVVYSLGR